MSKNVKEQGVHFFISEEGRPQYFIRLTLRYKRNDDDSWSGWCVELTTATDADTLPHLQEALLDLVQLHMDGTADVMDLKDWLTSREVALYPIPEFIRLENNGTASLAEPVSVTAVPA